MSADNRNRETCVSEFDKYTFILLNFLNKLDKTGNTSRIIDIAKMARRVDCEVLVTTVGPYLYRYGDKINARDTSLFSKELIVKELTAFDADPNNVSQPAHQTLALDMFDIIEKHRAGLTKKKMDWVWDTMNFILNTYFQYCIREPLDRK